MYRCYYCYLLLLLFLSASCCRRRRCGCRWFSCCFRQSSIARSFVWPRAFCCFILVCMENTQSLSHLNKNSQLSRTEYTLSQTEKGTYPHIASQPASHFFKNFRSNRQKCQWVCACECFDRYLHIILYWVCVTLTLYSLLSTYCYVLTVLCCVRYLFRSYVMYATYKQENQQQQQLNIRFTSVCCFSRRMRGEQNWLHFAGLSYWVSVLCV